MCRKPLLQGISLRSILLLALMMVATFGMLPVGVAAGGPTPTPA